MMGAAMADETEEDADVDDALHANIDDAHGAGQFDIVSAPVRYPRSPLIALILIALVPAIGLLVLHRWSDSEADDDERSRDAVGLLETALVGSVDLDGSPATEASDDESDGSGGAADVATAPLGTPVLSFRRTPDVVATSLSVSRLRLAVDPVLSFIGERSCAAVSVGGVPVTSVRSDLAVIPASNQKLLVAIAALEILGPDHVFTTSVAVPAAVDGEVDGDVYLVGGGDPLLTSDDFPLDDDRLTVASPTSLDVLADAIAAAGITRIRGAVVGDGSRYDDEFVIDEWADGVAFEEAGPYDALLVNDSLVLGGSSRQDDPNEAAAREFARLHDERDIRVDAGVDSGTASADVTVLAEVRSVPLSDVVGEMLLTSDNNTAEMLLKELGVAGSGEGTRTAGLNAMTQALDSLGVPMTGVSPRDGSGLSNQNRVTCAALLRIIQLGSGGPIDSALPVAGGSGTLASEFQDSAITGRLRAKTGTLNNEPFDADPPAVKALSGYVDPPGAGDGDREGDGATIEFVLVSNAADISIPDVYRPLWQALGVAFATHPAGPAADSLGPR